MSAIVSEAYYQRGERVRAQGRECRLGRACHARATIRLTFGGTSVLTGCPRHVKSLLRDVDAFGGILTRDALGTRMLPLDSVETY